MVLIATVAACSGGGSEAPGTSTALGSTSSTSAAPTTALPTTTTTTPEAAPEPAGWQAVCDAAYDAGMGNAASQERASWVADCSAECADPSNEATCAAMAADLDVGP